MTNYNSPHIRWAAFLPADLETEWMNQGLCHKIGSPNDWFPDSGEAHKASEAIAVCNQCPVRTQCLEFAQALEVNPAGNPLGAAHRSGIYGGLTPSARARVAKGKPAEADKLTGEARTTRARWKAVRVDCPDCDVTVSRGALRRHRIRRHNAVGVGERPSADCGTERGYQWHRYWDPAWPLPSDDPCGCRAAHARYERDRKAA